MLNGGDYQWGGAFITGATVLSLARLDAAAHQVWMQGEDGARRRIGLSELVDLSEPGVEVFITEPLDSAPA